MPNKKWYKVGVDLFTINGLEYLVLVELKTLNHLTANSIIIVLNKIISRQALQIKVRAKQQMIF